MSIELHGLENARVAPADVSIVDSVAFVRLLSVIFPGPCLSARFLSNIVYQLAQTLARRGRCPFVIEEIQARNRRRWCGAWPPKPDGARVFAPELLERRKPWHVLPASG